MSCPIDFTRVSTWDPRLVAAIQAHYPGSKGSPPGKKMAWEILECGEHVGWIGLGEPAYKLAPRRLLGIEDARPLPGTVGNYIFRLESPTANKASDILKAWHKVATMDWYEQYGWEPIHWETLIDPTKISSPVVGASYRRAGYRHIGSTTGRSAHRPQGHTHGPRVWSSSSPKELFYRGPLARLPRVNPNEYNQMKCVICGGPVHPATGYWIGSPTQYPCCGACFRQEIVPLIKESMAKTFRVKKGKKKRVPFYGD